jgi:hypothetical protein
MGFEIAQISLVRRWLGLNSGGARTGAVLLGAIALTSPMTVLPIMPLPTASAHQTQISDGVGGTHHIEPNDTPRAGEPSQAWFGLTQAGGTSIGLGDCDCALTLYDAAGTAIAQPTLKAISVEGLTDVPAAEVTFPQIGAYVLSLIGAPKGEAEFSSFRLDFPVTVAAGTVSAPAAAPVAAPLVQGSQEVETLAETEADLSAEGEASKTAPRKGIRSGAVLMLGGLVVLATILGWRKKNRDRAQ